jgi:multicomponent Na+:H+ antiporter subunit G
MSCSTTGAVVIEIIVIVLAAVGWAFSLSGAVGILRMPDVYCRIQCCSKMITMGALPVLIALVVGEGPISVFGSRALLVAVLLLVINPVASHALARTVGDGRACPADARRDRRVRHRRRIDRRDPAAERLRVR